LRLTILLPTRCLPWSLCIGRKRLICRRRVAGVTPENVRNVVLSENPKLPRSVSRSRRRCACVSFPGQPVVESPHMLRVPGRRIRPPDALDESNHVCHGANDDDAAPPA
jgi:hypothetical protein